MTLVRVSTPIETQRTRIAVLPIANTANAPTGAHSANASSPSMLIASAAVAVHTPATTSPRQGAKTPARTTTASSRDPLRYATTARVARRGRHPKPRVGPRANP
jgi:hypothetical protein